MSKVHGDRTLEPTVEEIVQALTASDQDAPLASISSLPQTCALCRLVTRSVIRGMRSFFVEFVNDPEARMRLRTSRGFCGPHTEVAAATGDALGIAILYADLADLSTELLTQRKPRRPSFSLRIKPGHQQAAVCPACTMESEAEKRYSGALAVALDASATDMEMHPWKALAEGEGLCVEHIERVASALSSVSEPRFTQMQVGKLKVLQKELEEIIRKNDYRFRGDAWGEERDAWLRALNRLARK